MMNETYRYATINGIKVALPRLGTSDSNLLNINNYPTGTSYSDSGSESNGSLNSTYDDLLAVWDAYNGTSLNSNINGIPPGYQETTYWSATPHQALPGNYFLHEQKNGYIGSRGSYQYPEWDSAANVLLQVFF
jgi:hypothetical protein